jgi:hypothetical protein
MLAMMVKLTADWSSGLSSKLRNQMYRVQTPGASRGFCEERGQKSVGQISQKFNNPKKTFFLWYVEFQQPLNFFFDLLIFDFYVDLYAPSNMGRCRLERVCTKHLV